MPSKNHRDGNPVSRTHGEPEEDRPHGTGRTDANDDRHKGSSVKPVKPRPRHQNKPRKRSAGRPISSLFSRATSRYRTRDSNGIQTHLGSWYRNYGDGTKVLYQSENHNTYPEIDRCWDQTHKLVRPVVATYRKNIYDGLHNIYGRPIHDDGGNLHLLRATAAQAGDEIQGLGSYDEDHFWAQFPGGFYYSYEGGFVPATWGFGYSQVDFINAGNSGPLGPDYGSALPYGAEAYNRYRPRITNTAGIQFLGDDLKDLPGQLAQTSKLMKDGYEAFLKNQIMSPASRREARHSLRIPSRLAGDYLNHQFGWAPFIGDLVGLYNTYQNQDRSMAQIARDNGSWIKRGGTLFDHSEKRDVVSTNSNTAVKVYPTLLSGLYRNSSLGPFEETTTYTELKRKVWFEGQFRYYVPEFDSGNRASHGDYGRIMRAVRLYGLTISPIAVWQLTPWTWLADWFTNASDVISNITATIYDRLVSKYAFVMCHTEEYKTQESTLYFRNETKQMRWTQFIECKDREKATPYGFGLSEGDLSARQISILAALGLSRAR